MPAVMMLNGGGWSNFAESAVYVAQNLGVA